MADLTLTPEEYQEYLKKGRKHKIVGYVEEEKKPNPIFNLIKGLTSPFRKAEATLEYGASSLPIYEALLKGDNQSVINALDKFKQHNYALLDENEQQRFVEDPEREALKSAAGIASYLAPMGKAGSVGEAVLNNAVAGAAGSFGYSKPGEELRDTLTGGAIGGALGATLHGLGRFAESVAPKAEPETGLATKVKRFGKDVELSGKGIDSDTLATLKNSKYYGKPELARKDADWLLNDMEKLGIKSGKTPQSVSRAVEKYVDRTNDEIARAIEEVGDKNVANRVKTVIQSAVLKNPTEYITGEAAQLANRVAYSGKGPETLAGLASRILNEGVEANIGGEKVFLKGSKGLQQLLRLDPENPVAQQIAEALGKASDGDMTLSEVAELRNNIANWANPASKIARNQKTKFLRDVRDGLTNVINSETGGKTEPLFKRLHVAKSIQPVLTKSAAREGRVGLRGLASVSTSKANVGKSLETMLGKGLQSGAEFAEGTGKGGEALRSLAGKLGKKGRYAPIAAAYLNDMSSRSERQKKLDTLEDIEKDPFKGGSSTATEFKRRVQDVYNQKVAARRALLRQYMAQGYKPSDAKVMVDMEIPKPKAWTPSSNDTKALSAVDAVDALRKSIEKYGMGANAASVLPMGGGTEPGRELKELRELLADAIGRMQTGAVINRDEARLYKRLIPNITDTHKSAMFKLQTLQNYLFQKISAPNYVYDQP